MITYATMLCIYPEHYYYLLRNAKGDNICIMKAEDKEKNKQLLADFDFKLVKGKDV